MGRLIKKLLPFILGFLAGAVFGSSKMGYKTIGKVTKGKLGDEDAGE